MHEERWEFLRDARRRWYWRYTSADGTHRLSMAFDTLTACVENAKQHGFVPTDAPDPKPE